MKKALSSSYAKEYKAGKRKIVSGRNKVVFKVLTMETTRVELPLLAFSKVFSYQTIGGLKKAYGLDVVKYIYRDPLDGKLKGDNPPDSLPLIANAHITVVGEIAKTLKFVKEATGYEG